MRILTQAVVPTMCGMRFGCFPDIASRAAGLLREPRASDVTGRTLCDCGGTRIGAG